MFVNVNFSREVYEYFKEYDLSQVANTLLDMYDFTNLPSTEGKRYTERRLCISNQEFITLYNTLGPRNKKVSLARLFEFAYNMDVLSLPRFETLRNNTKNDPLYKAITALDKAYRALLDAYKAAPSDDLKLLVDTTYNYKLYLEEALNDER